jgi:hypothetical protein
MGAQSRKNSWRWTTNSSFLVQGIFFIHAKLRPLPDNRHFNKHGPAFQMTAVPLQDNLAYRYFSCHQQRLKWSDSGLIALSVRKKTDLIAFVRRKLDEL